MEIGRTHKRYKDGSTLRIKRDHRTYIATLSKTADDKVSIEYHWMYEARSLQAISKWVNLVKKAPLNCKYYENGFYNLPHNRGFGNNTGKRQIVQHN